MFPFDSVLAVTRPLDQERCGGAFRLCAVLHQWDGW